MDDDLIDDPALASLLNEDREIYVGEKFYKYTEMGLVFCDSEDKVELDNYLVSLTPQERISIKEANSNIPQSCQNVNISANVNELTSEISIFQTANQTCSNGWNGSNSVPIVNPPTTLTNYMPLGDIDKRNFQVCNVLSQGFFENIFGPTESCYSYLPNNRRVKTRFWNQNYFLFSSIGCKTKVQKHVSNWFASWWEKSYAERMEMGVNYITYDYNFNVPAFNQA